MLLVIFVGVLVALFLRGLADWVGKHLSWSPGWSLAAVVMVLILITGFTAYALAPEIGRQAGALAEELPRAVDRVESQLQSSTWGAHLLKSVENGAQAAAGARTALSKAQTVLSSSIGLLAAVVICFFVGLYLAISPQIYSQAIVRLFRAHQRPRVQEVLCVLKTALQRWLIGRVALMITNAVATAVGLWLLGLPLALTLGIISGVLNFVPNLGPIIAGIPAVLLALMEGPTKALYVTLFYIGYQALDGYVLTPLVQKRTVSLPPALTIASQAVLGVLLGTMGVVLAVPMVAIAVILLKMLYLRDRLGEQIELPA